MKALHVIAFILVVVGALNWGLIGLFDFNLVMKIFGGMPAVEKLIYVLVGLAAVYEIATHKHNCKVCAAGEMSAPKPTM